MDADVDTMRLCSREIPAGGAVVRPRGVGGGPVKAAARTWTGTASVWWRPVRSGCAGVDADGSRPGRVEVDAAGGVGAEAERPVMTERCGGATVAP